MPGGQVPQRHRQRPGPVHLKGHPITHRNSIEHIETLAPQHPAPPLSSLKDAGQVPHRPIRKEDVGELTLHNIHMKEPGQLLPDSTTTNSLVITNRHIHKRMPLQTRHTHQRRTPPTPEQPKHRRPSGRPSGGAFSVRFTWSSLEPPVGFEPTTYALQKPSGWESSLISSGSERSPTRPSTAADRRLKGRFGSSEAPRQVSPEPAPTQVLPRISSSFPACTRPSVHVLPQTGPEHPLLREAAWRQRTNPSSRRSALPCRLLVQRFAFALAMHNHTLTLTSLGMGRSGRRLPPGRAPRPQALLVLGPRRRGSASVRSSPPFALAQATQD